MKHPYKVIENHWGDIFIIKAGIRQFDLGEFGTKEKAQEKCNELNGVKEVEVYLDGERVSNWISTSADEHGDGFVEVDCPEKGLCVTEIRYGKVEVFNGELLNGAESNDW